MAWKLVVHTVLTAAAGASNKQERILKVPEQPDMIAS